MYLLREIRRRFSAPLATLVNNDDIDPLLEMILSSQDAKFGDYQANCAMPLGKRLGESPREIAQRIISQLEIDDLCQTPEVAGPGFINVSLHDDWMVQQLQKLVHDPELGIRKISQPRTYVVDFSSPNVAKPMHVGHIRSTVIGDALCRTLRFLGHRVISDNHLGDWGTQFGMIIYGYKHFRDETAYAAKPIVELSRLYRLVRRLMDFHEGCADLSGIKQEIEKQQALLSQQETAAGGKPNKHTKKQLRSLRDKLDGLIERRDSILTLVSEVEADPQIGTLAEDHADIARNVLAETAKLHEGDNENRELWEQFLPHCRADIQRVYKRLDIQFDHELGESFYHDRLGAVVDNFEERGMARVSDGAVCVFLEGFDTPMIIRKQDGAFLYATTDLATIAFRSETWNPDAMLYVVDHRQGEHFDKLFETARQWGHDSLEFQHISFGTVLGSDGKPFKTRSGDTVGLEGLLDEAESKALDVVLQNNLGAELDGQQCQQVAKVVGMGALKYADLSHNRTSDYVFSYDKMLSLRGNTATYCQYAYARTQSIFARGEVDVDALRQSSVTLRLHESAERRLGLELLRFPDAVASVADDYRPNLLTNYLFELANCFATFFEACPVLKAGNEEDRQSRLLLCDLTGRVLRQGLALLGIDVVDKM
ncbi:MAG: arginine--tRNA ligase [Pirellulaceae bacterium]|nr:arginine--tRNA ligase [Pirellulaceae bacterium]